MRGRGCVRGRGLVCVPGACMAGRMCGGGGGYGVHGSGGMHGMHTPPVDRMTDPCKKHYLAAPQTSFAGGKTFDS